MVDAHRDSSGLERHLALLGAQGGKSDTAPLAAYRAALPSAEKNWPSCLALQSEMPFGAECYCRPAVQPFRIGWNRMRHAIASCDRCSCPESSRAEPERRAAQCICLSSEGSPDWGRAQLRNHVRQDFGCSSFDSRFGSRHGRADGQGVLPMQLPCQKECPAGTMPSSPASESFELDDGITLDASTGWQNLAATRTV